MRPQSRGGFGMGRPILHMWRIGSAAKPEHPPTVDRPSDASVSRSVTGQSATEAQDALGPGGCVSYSRYGDRLNDERVNGHLIQAASSQSNMAGSGLMRRRTMKPPG